MSNCIKSRYEKCPLKDDCFGLVDDSEDCKCRLEDYQQGRADAIESCIEILARLVTMELLDLNTYEMVKAELKE